ncbi:MAG: CapA family protein [Crocinitomicaceae bacterium]|nr:CapA family protein [Crocinitomicaceae bacterium]
MIHIQRSKLRLLFKVLSVFLAVNVSFFSFGQEENPKLSLLFVGDVMQHDGQIDAAYNSKTKEYEYDDGFKFIKPIINEYDIRVANLEVTLAGKPFKGYPQFSAPDELSEVLVNSGFNVILTSNNHSCDRGSKGVIRTLDVLDELGVPHTGTFRNQKERDDNYPLVVEKNGLKVAMLNYTYGTNGLSVAKPLIINYIDSVIIKEDIAKAKSMGVDYIVCNMHWGKEYKPLPNGYQKRYEAVCYRAGADMVIGGHPHVVQPIEKKKVYNQDKLTIWSLGNFVSNMQTRTTRGGVMLGAHIAKEKGKVILGDVNHHFVYVMKRKEGTVTQYYILPDFDYNKHRVNFVSAVEAQRMKDFFSDSRKLYNAENKGEVVEKIVDPNSVIGQSFKQMLTSYYSVKVGANGSELMTNDLLGHYFHRTVDQKGLRNYLSGMYFDQNMAKGHKNFLRDCGIEGVSLVLVTPEGIKTVTE